MRPEGDAAEREASAGDLGLSGGGTLILHDAPGGDHGCAEMLIGVSEPATSPHLGGERGEAVN